MEKMNNNTMYNYNRFSFNVFKYWNIEEIKHQHSTSHSFAVCEHYGLFVSIFLPSFMIRIFMVALHFKR